ncbi:MAG: hypothetical protein PHT31_02570, partial [Candidatus Omnitrophica bacterium]|nr:hypothetical protein [Candidatus Omnitrophota bacterium]
MKKFAFIFHPHDIDFLADGFNDPGLKQKNPKLISSTLKWFPPFQREKVTGIKSDFDGQQIEGLMILVTLIPEHMKDLNDKFALSKFVEAGRLAQDLGASIIGLGAYAALYGRHGVDIAAACKIPVTTGNSYTVGVTPEVILKVLKSNGKDPEKSCITILGATGIVGAYCLQALKDKVGKMNLLSSNYKRIKEFLGAKKFKAQIKPYALTDKPDYILESDLVLIGNGKYAPLINLLKVKKGTIIYDCTYPKSFKDQDYTLRDDILFIDGGAILPPGNPDFHFTFGFPKGMAFPCMAETMILTFEDMFESYSIGRSIDFVKAMTMDELAKKHG